jgi:hypothetical protein
MLSAISAPIHSSIKGIFAASEGDINVYKAGQQRWKKCRYFVFLLILLNEAFIPGTIPGLAQGCVSRPIKKWKRFMARIGEDHP